MQIDNIDLSNFKKEISKLDYDFADALYILGGIPYDIYKEIKFNNFLISEFNYKMDFSISELSSEPEQEFEDLSINIESSNNGLTGLNINHSDMIKFSKAA